MPASNTPVSNQVPDNPPTTKVGQHAHTPFGSGQVESESKQPNGSTLGRIGEQWFEIEPGE